MTKASWFSTTRRPRILAGEISAMYMGDSSETAPTPSPPENARPSVPSHSGGSHRRPTTRETRRPRRSARLFGPRGRYRRPDRAAPTMAPIKNELTRHSDCHVVSAKHFSTKISGPAMMAISKPNM